MRGKAVRKHSRKDESLTDLVDARGVSKNDFRFEVLGTLDEVSSALGLVRATDECLGSRDLILEIQSDLCWMMSELSVVADEKTSETHITVDRVAALDKAYGDLVTSHPHIAAELEDPEFRAASFASRGQSVVGASMHLACSNIRRAERQLQLFADLGQIHNPNIIPYVSRLLTLMYAMARAEEGDSRSGDDAER
jgi:cob(I)alamin adenosyltransferase